MKNVYSKSLLLLSALVLLTTSPLLAQLDLNEKGFSFQGYAKNSEGAALSSASIEVQFTIYPDGGSSEFTEVQTVTTDAFGVFHLVIGSSSTAAFKALDFINKNNYKLKVETRVVGGTYATISDAIMQSVPYAQAADNGVPIGSLIIFAGPKANIPAGWLPCDGELFDNTAYPKLFATLGTAWGGTSTQFRVPDMRGLFPRGVTDGSANDPDASSRTAINTGGNTGDKVGSYQNYATGRPRTTALGGTTDGAGGHSHGYVDGGFQEVSNNWSSGGASSPGDGTGRNTDGNKTTDTALDHTHSFTVTTGGDSETRPANVNVWYIIRAR